MGICNRVQKFRVQRAVYICQQIIILQSWLVNLDYKGILKYRSQMPVLSIELAQKRASLSGWEVHIKSLSKFQSVKFCDKAVNPMFPSHGTSSSQRSTYGSFNRLQKSGRVQGFGNYTLNYLTATPNTSHMAHFYDNQVQACVCVCVRTPTFFHVRVTVKRPPWVSSTNTTHKAWLY